MLTNGYRNEWKFLLEGKNRSLLYERLRQALVPDKHCGPDGSYTVHSLYFDDLMDSCAKENEAGTDPRAKYRIRFYENESGTMHLERKEKLNGRSRKLLCPLRPDQYQKIIAGEASDVFWGTNEPLLRKLCAAIMSRCYSPKLALDYKRTALTEPAMNIRVTFDSAVYASDSVYGFPAPSDCPSVPVLSGKDCILEIKYNNILPGWLRELVESVPLRQISFSKYYMGRKMLEEVYR